MSPAVAEMTMLTPTDLLARPDGGRGYELVDGRLEEMPVSAKSSRIGGQLSGELLRYSDVHPAWVFAAGTGFCCFADDLNRVRKPDAAFLALDRYSVADYEKDDFIATVPDIVAEVISPNDVAYAVDRKIDEWLAAGVKVVWVVHPEVAVVREHRPDGTIRQLRPADALTEPTLLPGFACPVAELFRLPTAAP